jgi:hypothetical protein
MSTGVAAPVRDHRPWKAALLVFGIVGLATGVVRVPGFWSSYVLDLVGPAWNYILLRGLFSKKQPAMLSRFLSPERALILILTVCALVETAQFFELYDARFDPSDFVAYASLLIPCYVIDRVSLQRSSSGTK